MAIFSPFISPYDPYDMQMQDRLQPPNAAHLFGTDNFGRDIFSRVVHGARLSLLSGFSSVVFASVFGILVGILAGYFERLEGILMRLVDVFMAFPPLLLALIMMAILGRGLLNVVMAVGIAYLTRISRVTFGLTLKIKEDPYIEAARAMGASNPRILFMHILPNLLSPIIVQASFTFAFSLLQIAALDFLGLGLPPEIPSWGGMLNQGRTYITRAPWLLVFPGMFIVITVLSFNLLGDALRDQLDPRFQEEVTA
uniref:Peptide ABC transporter permease protein n=1 Tax=uncultured organism TaxID=155900 RepID=M1PPV1_9ZZZZ|nr:peptide ABC transporter permease protein [uncultured organism]